MVTSWPVTILFYLGSFKAPPQVKVKPVIVKKLTLEDKIQAMDQTIKKLTDLLSSGAIHPTVINNNTVVNINNNLSISDMGAFKILSDRMGEEEATDFLCKLASNPRIITLFEKVYLDGEPSEHPIANVNGEDFIYRDETQNLIHDIGGAKILKLGERLLKKHIY